MDRRRVENSSFLQALKIGLSRLIQSELTTPPTINVSLLRPIVEKDSDAIVSTCSIVTLVFLVFLRFLDGSPFILESPLIQQWFPWSRKEGECFCLILLKLVSEFRTSMIKYMGANSHNGVT